MIFVEKENLVYFENENGVRVAWIEYEQVEPNHYNILHTVVHPDYRGLGLANKLVEIVVNNIRRKGGKVTATCSYAQKWLEKASQI